MTPTERQRMQQIEDDAEEAIKRCFSDTAPENTIAYAKMFYKAGAYAQHDKARNQAIQDCIERLKAIGWSEYSYNGKIMLHTLEQLKTKP